MTEEEKHQQFVNTMEFLEIINGLIEASKEASELPFEKLSREDWEIFQEGQYIVATVLSQIKTLLVDFSPKIIDNDALNAHLTAVLLAPE